MKLLDREHTIYVIERLHFVHPQNIESATKTKAVRILEGCQRRPFAWPACRSRRPLAPGRDIHPATELAAAANFARPSASFPAAGTVAGRMLRCPEGHNDLDGGRRSVRPPSLPDLRLGTVLEFHAIRSPVYPFLFHEEAAYLAPSRHVEPCTNTTIKSDVHASHAFIISGPRGETFVSFAIITIYSVSAAEPLDVCTKRGDFFCRSGVRQSSGQNHRHSVKSSKA